MTSCWTNATVHGVIVPMLEIQDGEVDALEIRHVARHMEVEDLAVARTRDLVGAREPVLDENAARRTLSRAHDVLVRPEPGNLDGYGVEGRSLVSGEREDALQLADERGTAGGLSHDRVSRQRFA